MTLACDNLTLNDLQILYREEIVSNTLDGSSRYNILDDGTLKIENTRDSDSGVYECIARNTAGEAKATAVELRYFGNRGQIYHYSKKISLITSMNLKFFQQGIFTIILIYCDSRLLLS